MQSPRNTFLKYFWFFKKHLVAESNKNTRFWRTPGRRPQTPSNFINHNIIRHNIIRNWFKGAGGRGPRSIFTFLMFLIKENVSHQELFQNEKLLFLAKVIEFSNRENTYNYIAHANFNRDSPKIYLKNYLLLHFLR